MLRTFITYTAVRGVLAAGGVAALLTISGSHPDPGAVVEAVTDRWDQSSSGGVMAEQRAAVEANRAANRAAVEETAAAIAEIRERQGASPLSDFATRVAPLAAATRSGLPTPDAPASPTPTSGTGGTGGPAPDPTPPPAPSGPAPQAPSPSPAEPPPSGDEGWTFTPGPTLPPPTTAPPAPRITNVSASYNGLNWLSAGDYATPQSCPPGGASVSYTATYADGRTASGSTWVSAGGVTWANPPLGGSIRFGYYFPGGGGCASTLGWG